MLTLPARLTLAAFFVGAALASASASGSDATAEAGTAAEKTVDCDIVVAGGSTASLAAAITAAEADASLTVCFTEITDWPGGQMTAGVAASAAAGTMGERERWRWRREEEEAHGEEKVKRERS